LINMVHYTVSGKYIEVSEQRADNFIRELALHPKEVFDEYFPKLLAWMGPNFHTDWVSYDQVRAKVFTDADWIIDNGF